MFIRAHTTYVKFCQCVSSNLIKQSKRIVLSLITILMSFCFFAVSASEARADGRFSNLCQRAYMTGNETLLVYCKSSSG